MYPHVRAAIAGIGEDAWSPIRYPRAIWDGQLRRWVSVPPLEVRGRATLSARPMSWLR